MKYCTYCGKELVDQALICPKCGCAACGSQADLNKNSQSGSLSAFSLVGFILSFFFQLLGLIFSIIAYKNAIKEGDERSKNFAKAGIIICTVVYGLIALYFIFAIILICIAVFA